MAFERMFRHLRRASEAGHGQRLLPQPTLQAPAAGAAGGADSLVTAPGLCSLSQIILHLTSSSFFCPEKSLLNTHSGPGQGGGALAHGPRGLPAQACSGPGVRSLPVCKALKVRARRTHRFCSVDPVPGPREPLDSGVEAWTGSGAESRERDVLPTTV